ncbi:branched-chain amino acid ABC transporter permease [Bradyrhizobium sp. NP1]|uniref:branched-chain amino acid ABC transporter permease n=1 Tax=Bradyrhizobium sp. NP1 TaxID=3049772 RepID=UPI0025A5D1BB|nr:branched-chain amino acid ABC transporter permease [Bradyrhizobium sp. NP1]WJR76872.1 branched-chain amino acid ABC transporter permease [Bradyrhizobium sp. NP1]
MIYGLGASALGFAIRHGGLASFGHAAFFGLGAYAVLAANLAGLKDAFIVWPLAIGFVAMVATLIGLLSLRTRGVSFIMLTLGFAQMFFIVVSSIQGFGAADGKALPERNSIAGLSIADTVTFHYVVLAVLVAISFVIYRLSHASMGAVLRGIACDERRMRALGFRTPRLQLLSFVFSAAATAVAGILAANYYYFVSPSYLHWIMSGDLLAMAALGGIGSLYGGMFGAFVLVIVEVILAPYTTYWRLFLGLLIVLSVLLFDRGVHPALNRALGGRDD